MLRSNRDGVSVRMNGKEGWVSGTRSRQHSALSLPLVAFLGILCWRGLSPWPYLTGACATCVNGGSLTERPVWRTPRWV